jgi:phosphoribosylaminoimidazole-succinocarboxamide synthase
LAIEDVINKEDEIEILKGRAIVAYKLKPLPIEAVVRGYLIGSSWKDYKKKGEVCGIILPSGLKQAEKLSDPIFTPTTKENVGNHDENIDFGMTKDLIGEELANKVRDISLRIYSEAVEYAIGKGIIIADTKFEFGLDEDNQLVLIDELLTPDSSRFWPIESYKIGISPPSFDKQYVRDYLETLNWNKRSPGPKLPDEIIKKTSEKYQDARKKLIS